MSPKGKGRANEEEEEDGTYIRRSHIHGIDQFIDEVLPSDEEELAEVTRLRSSMPPPSQPIS